MSGPKSFEISKHVVLEAYRRVKANKGAAGVDGESIEQFEADLKGNLYKLWNRMSSGCYFPPPVRMVEIHKPGGRGGQGPRGAHGRGQNRADGGGHGPGAGGGDDVPPGLLWVPAAHVARWTRSRPCRERCWRTDWMIDMDIQGFFDNLDHDLVLKAVAHHTDQRWILLYVERWLKAPLQRQERQPGRAGSR